MSENVAEVLRKTPKSISLQEIFNIVEIEELHYMYKDGTKALAGINLSIRKNTRVALLGPNGAGKSTLLLHLNAINLPQQGTVTIDGIGVSPKTEKLIRTKVGLVFQDPDDQVFSTTVREDVEFGPHNMGLSHEEINLRVNSALEAVKMTGYADKAPFHLSYGQKKRVAIAGILAMSPDIIVLDEPMAYLDPAGKKSLMEILNYLHDNGKTIIIATHDVDLAAEWADHVVIVTDGRILAEGDGTLLTNPDIIENAELDFPTVTKIFRKLPELKLNTIPRTVTDAVVKLKQLMKL